MRSRIIPCGAPPPLLGATVVGGDVSRVWSPPRDATHLLYFAFMSFTASGEEFPIHVEVSWVDSAPGGATTGVATSAQRIPIAWNRAGVAQLDAVYFAGLDGRGEPLRQSQADPGEWMQLFAFLAGSELPTGGEAFIRLQWGREVCEDC